MTVSPVRYPIHYNSIKDAYRILSSLQLVVLWPTVNFGTLENCQKIFLFSENFRPKNKI